MWAGGGIGYSSTSVASPDSTAEILFDNTSASSLILKNTPVFAASSTIVVSGFAQPGSYLVNYTTNTGIVQVYGDYQISGSTLALDYTNELYASTATTPIDMSGHGNSAVVNQTYDAYAVSQLITATYQSGTWSVVGSSTGLPVLNLCLGRDGRMPQQRQPSIPSDPDGRRECGQR